ncbi:protein MAINTENANCE OF MERISTEMS-like [Papaver somniferum]|uniref:protein MAINTENANCE OF MERISTEMS-like n=1 Tax=Papaver somniferum TaxID=3469 RepID=UPI000E6FF886|nr:protein MAINTENANCE OF MERISTEMS-like [Papaver somniferum]
MLDLPLSDECERFKQIIKNSGLYTVAENSMLEHDRVAISESVERFYPETDTFHMLFGEMTITLDDALQILRLPDHGTAVKYSYTKLCSWEKLYDLTKKCFGWDDATSKIEFGGYAAYRTRQSNMGHLMTMFKGTLKKEKEGTLTDDQVNYADTAYLLCVLGCVIFPNASSNRVDANLLQLLHSLNKVHEYSWGTTCHAFLMEELRKASRRGTSQIAGNVSLLQASRRGIPENVEWQKDNPRGTKYVFDDNRSRTKEQQLVRMREVLDSMQSSYVFFDPYKGYRDSGHIAGRSNLTLYFGPLWLPT